MREVLGFITMLVMVAIVAVFAAMLSGCNNFGASLVVSAVDDYCTLPPEDRAAYRGLINSRVRPNAVKIECSWGSYD